MKDFLFGHGVQELPQKIYPICSYGRAENFFYQSADSLAPFDLSTTAVLQLVQNNESPVFPSHILDREDHRPLLTSLISAGLKPRIQVALGREWQDLESQILWANEIGCGFDILIDRSLELIGAHSYLDTLVDWRWIACPLRFFDLTDLLQSLSAHSARREIHLCFFEPRDRHTLLMNPDEVILAKSELTRAAAAKWLETIVLMRPLSALTTCSGFYQAPTLEHYQENFVASGRYPVLRQSAWSVFRHFPQLFSFLVYLGQWLVTKTPRPAFFKPLTNRCKSWYAKNYWPTHRFFNRVKIHAWNSGVFVIYKTHHWYCTSIMILGWGRIKMENFFKYRFRYSMKYIFEEIPGRFFRYIKYRSISAYHYGSFVFRCKIWYPGRHAVWRTFFVLSWPLFKIYWFLAFQFKKRLRPRWRKHTPR